MSNQKPHGHLLGPSLSSRAKMSNKLKTTPARSGDFAFLSGSKSKKPFGRSVTALQSTFSGDVRQLRRAKRLPWLFIILLVLAFVIGIVLANGSNITIRGQVPHTSWLQTTARILTSLRSEIGLPQASAESTVGQIKFYDMRLRVFSNISETQTIYAVDIPDVKTVDGVFQLVVQPNLKVRLRKLLGQPNYVQLCLNQQWSTNPDGLVGTSDGLGDCGQSGSVNHIFDRVYCPESDRVGVISVLESAFGATYLPTRSDNCPSLLTTKSNSAHSFLNQFGLTLASLGNTKPADNVVSPVLTPTSETKPSAPAVSTPLLQLIGRSLSIRGGNTIELPPSSITNITQTQVVSSEPQVSPQVSPQSLSLVGTTLTLSGGGSIDLSNLLSRATSSYVPSYSVSYSGTGGGSGGSTPVVVPGVSSTGPIDTKDKSSDGGVVSSPNLYLQTADTNSPGLVSTTAQAFAGPKTFGSPITLSGATSGFTTISSPAIAGSYVLTLPSTAGTVGQFLQTNGFGQTIWANASVVATADNGLTLATTNVQLGGNLLQATVIGLGSYSLSLTGSLVTTDITSTGIITVDSGSRTGIRAVDVTGDLKVSGTIDPMAILFSGDTVGDLSTDGYRIGIVTGQTQRPIYISPLTDATKVFQVRLADGLTPLLNVDTDNQYVSVGGDTAVAAFDIIDPGTAKPNRGNLNIPYTTSQDVGVIMQGGSRLIHTYGSVSGANQNFFIGFGAGNFTTTGTLNNVFGNEAGRSLTTGTANVVIGPYAGYALTTAVGQTIIGSSAYSRGTAGGESVIVGGAAAGDSINVNQSVVLGGYAGSGQLFNTINQSVLVGWRAGYNLTSPAGGNTFIGFGSGSNVSTGFANVFVGGSAGSSVTTGGSNVIVQGSYGSNGVTTGSSNTIINASPPIQTGGSNVVINSLVNPEGPSDGSTQNVLIGSSGVRTKSDSATDPITQLMVGSSALGYQSTIDNGSVVSATAIGRCANVATDGAVVLGSVRQGLSASPNDCSSVDTNFRYSKVAIGRSDAAYKLDVYNQGGDDVTSGLDPDIIARFRNTTGQECLVDLSGVPGVFCSSDAKLKKDIEPYPVGNATAELSRLNVLNFHWLSDTDSSKHTGFVAQDVEQIFPELVKTYADDTGVEHKSLNTTGMIPYIVATVQEQQKFIDQLKQGAATVSGLAQQATQVANSVIIAVKATIDELVVRHLVIGSNTQAAGITMYDQQTAQPYCIVISGGQLIPTAGACIAKP